METHTNQDNGEAYFHEVKEILDRADTKFLDHECDHREEHEPGRTPPRTLYQISNGLPCKPGDLMMQGPLSKFRRFTSKPCLPIILFKVELITNGKDMRQQYSMLVVEIFRIICIIGEKLESMEEQEVRSSPRAKYVFVGEGYEISFDLKAYFQRCCYPQQYSILVNFLQLINQILSIKMQTHPLS